MITMFCCLWFFTGKPWAIDGTDIFSPLDRNGYAVSASFTFYLMNAAESSIHLYDRNGRFIRAIGGRGQGPGEFRFLSGIRLVGNRLYAFDAQTSKFSVFDESGTFISTHTAPRDVLFNFPYSERLFNGWVFKSEKRMVLWADDDFQAKKVLAEVPAIDHPANARLVMPARDKPSFTVSRDKKRIFIYPGKGKFEIQIYDVVRRQFLPSIVKDRPRIPFDEEYGEERFRKLLSYQGRARHQQSRFKPIYPEYFPAVEHLAVDLDGYLIVWPGVHMMNKKTPALVLGETGREIKPRFPPKHHARLLAVDGDYVYVSVYRDEEIGVRKVLISELDRFFQEYPDNG